MEKMSWEEGLDSKNIIFVKIHLSDGCSEVLDIVVSYFSIIKGESREIMRFDGSKKEKVNVHRFYLKKKQKLYLDKELSLQTVEEFISEIKTKWFIYRMKYEENNYI